MIYIYYHNADFDGLASGAITFNAVKSENSSIYLKGIDYSEYDFKEEYDKWGDEDKVYVVDFSFQGNMKKVYDKLKERLIFIDHHKSAIEEIEGLNVSGLQSTKMSACRLCWRYFHKNEPEPEAIKLLGMYDVWDLNDKVENFQYGVTLLDLEPTSTNWKTLFHSNKNIIDEICKKGEVIKKYLSITDEKFAKKTSFEIKIDGYKAVCLNQSRGGMPFESVFDQSKHDIMLSFTKLKSPDMWKVSFYTDGDYGPDVSEIAKTYGGGGHKNSAGCEISTSMLTKMLKGEIQDN